MDVSTLLKREKKGYSDLVGIDFSPAATLVVRLKKTRSAISLVGLEQLPGVDLADDQATFHLEKHLAANYGCLTYSGENTVLRAVAAPLAEGEAGLSESALQDLLNIGDEFRVSAKLLQRGRGRQDSTFLAAAIPEKDTEAILRFFEVGAPAALALEVAGLSYITAFLYTRGAECQEESVCLIDSGEECSYFAFLQKGEVALVGKYVFGARQLRSKVMSDLGVDEELAMGILADQSINVSATIMEVMSPFMKQLSISKDFVERRFGSKITKVYVSGETGQLSTWVEVVEQMLHAKVIRWSPFENIEYDSELFDDTLRGNESRYVAAVGAALGGFEE